MKTCNCCKLEKPKTDFYKKPTAKDGLFWWCKVCHKESMKAKYHKQAQNETYRTREKARINAFWTANPEIRKNCDQNYADTHRPQLRAHASKHRAAKVKRTPSWLTVDDFWIMEEAHALAVQRTKMLGFSWHVDHIVPLHGALVSGLHVPHNLQVIPAWENRRKANKFPVTT